MKNEPPLNVPSSNKPIAIVLDLNVTGLGIVHGLAAGGVQVHGILLEKANRPGRLSRYIKCLDQTEIGFDTSRLADWLIQYAASFENPPIIIPTSDITALMIAHHRARFEKVSSIWKNTAEALDTIISKDKLHTAAAKADVPIPPSIHSTNVDEILRWCKTNPAPYLIKPFFEGANSNVLHAKNRFTNNLKELQQVLDQVGTSGLIIQRCIKGGDGHIFDCYGYCDEKGQIITMASHRRIRQCPKDFGTTTFGEIPANSKIIDENAIFTLTEKLLSKVKYHGIFGIEWLQDKKTQELYLIDFNARPFLTIQHLLDCGLNLPYIAYQDLTGRIDTNISLKPKLKRMYWLDFSRYLKSANQYKKQGKLNWWPWFSSVFKARSFAVFNWKDLGPTLVSLHQLIGMFFRTLLRVLKIPFRPLGHK